MKKYVKPELFYERYELSQHIADCAVEWVANTDPLNCIANLDPAQIGVSGTVFVQNNTVCTSTDETYCITNGSGSSLTFVS